MASWNISVGDGDLKADGTVPMSADWTFGNQDLVDIKQLGIGTASPAGIVHVSTAGAADALRIRDDTGSTGLGRAPSSTYRLAVNASGMNNGGVSITGVQEDDWGIMLQGGSMTASGLRMDGTAGAALDLRSGGDLNISIRTEAVSFVDTGHNLLIGTQTDSGGKLQVRGVGTALTAPTVITETVALFVGAGTSAADCRIALIGGGGAGSVCALDFGDPADQAIGSISYDHATNAMTFATVAAVRMTIGGDGRILIGTTGAAGAPLHAVGGSGGATSVMRIEQLDIDDSFINFIGTSAADSTASLSSSTAEASAKTVAILCEVNSVEFWLRGYASAV